jgi:hypothetical protein
MYFGKTMVAPTGMDKIGLFTKLLFRSQTCVKMSRITRGSHQQGSGHGGVRTASHWGHPDKTLLTPQLLRRLRLRQILQNYYSAALPFQTTSFPS